MPSLEIETFICRWSTATASERAKPEIVAEILETLATLGRAHRKGNQFTR